MKVPESSIGIVLVVDDSPTVRTVVKRHLVNQNLQVLEAESGARARQVLQAIQPDLIILDLVLPDISGLDLCRELRNDARLWWVPIMIITVKSEVEERILGYDCGADDYITKPFDSEELALRARARVERVRKLRDEALLDGLTGCYTRRFFIEKLEEEIQRYHRYRQIFSLMLCDLDDFKQVNDKWGHLTGDFVLREFTAFLRWSFRRSDIVGRYGGEEFAVLMPGIPIAAAAGAASRARRAWVEHILIEPRSECRINITFSAGLAEVGRHGVTAHDLLASADRALYAAKAAGKNRIFFAGDPHPRPAVGRP